MTKQSYIAVDLGAESGRVMLAAVDASGVFLREMHRFTNGPVRVGPTLYWDVLRLWNEIKVGLAKAIAENPDIAGVGVDTWGVDFGLLDEYGQLIGNPVHYRDARTEGVSGEFFTRLAHEKVYGLTGIQTLPFNTLFQLVALTRRNPGALAGARHLLFIPDLLVYWLCGRMVNEYTIASTSQMLHAHTRRWAPEILAAIPAPVWLFPEIVMPGTVLGPIADDVVALPKHTNRVIPVIAVGSHDTASAVAAVPAAGEDWLFLSSGTWSLLGVEVCQPVLSPKAAQYNFTNEGGVEGRIRLLKNIAGLWPLQECRRAWAEQGREFDYQTLLRLAREEPARSALLNLDDAAMLSPGDMPRKIVEQCRRTGQSVPETPGRFTRVILESLAARYARVKDMLTDVTGRGFKRLHIVGGGSQNELLNQMTADATGLEVHAGPVEATAIGNVLAQALATGQIPSLAAGRELVAKTALIRVYQPRETDRWQNWAATMARREPL